MNSSESRNEKIIFEKYNLTEVWWAYALFLSYLSYSYVSAGLSLNDPIKTRHKIFLIILGKFEPFNEFLIITGGIEFK